MTVVVREKVRHGDDPECWGPKLGLNVRKSVRFLLGEDLIYTNSIASAGPALRPFLGHRVAALGTEGFSFVVHLA